LNTSIGLLVVIGACAAGFVLSGGHLLALFQPYEFLIIGGAAFGAMVMSNPISITIGIIKSTATLFKKSPYTKELYLELLAMLYAIFNVIRKDGELGIEKHIDDPDESPLFSEYPMVDQIHGARQFIIDYLRVMTLGGISTHDLDALFEAELETHHEESHQIPGALTKVADGLPGFGIVAAVMGIVITMGHIGGPPEELGHHVAAALVGTFLGILLSYGVVGPMAAYLEHITKEEGNFFLCIKTAMMANFSGSPPTVAIEFGRKVLFHEMRPGFEEVEERVRGPR